MKGPRQPRPGPAVIAVVAALLMPAMLHAQDLPEIMPVSELRPGMTGYGVVALSDSAPQRFDVEVLAVVTGWLPKGDIILVKMRGPVIDEAGIVAGMSGSPVFIDDKLVGAVAYGWPFSKIPLAGLTPAAEMLTTQSITEKPTRPERAAHRAEAARAKRRRFGEVASLLLSAGGRDDPSRLQDAMMRAALPEFLEGRPHRSQALQWPLGNGTVAEFEPLPIPLNITGGPPAARLMQSGLSGGALLAVQGETTGETDADRVELRPGVPVGALFVSGDMEVSGMGTLTWVDGDRVVAFGHPLFGAGEVDLPMILGRAQTVVPSIYRSFRLSAAERVIGRVVQDRDSAIVGRLGEDAPMFPCRVRVNGAVQEEYNYQVAGFWQTAPLFTYYAVAASSARWQGQAGRYTFEAEAEIVLKNRPEPLVLSNVFAGPSTSLPSLQLVALPLSALLTNQFKEVEVESVDYRLNIREGFEAAVIESVTADRLLAEPGSQVTLLVTLRRWRGGEDIKEVTLSIPETARPGTDVEVLVCDAVTSTMVDARLDPGFFAPTSFKHLMDMLERIESNRNLVVRASFIEQGLRYCGQPLPTLPSSALNILQFGGAGRARRLISDRVEPVHTPYVLTGSQTVAIRIVEPEPFNP